MKNSVASSTGEIIPLYSAQVQAASQILCPALGPSLQEGHCGVVMSPEKGRKAREGSGAPVL